MSATYVPSEIEDIVGLSTALAAKADDSAVVHKTGSAQTIDAATTFASRVAVTGSGLDVGGGTHATPASVDVHLSTSDTGTERAFRFRNDNVNAANNYFRGFQLSLGDGHDFSDGFIVLSGIDNTGTGYQIFRALRSGSTPQITFLGRTEIPLISNQSTDIGASVTNWQYDGIDLRIGPQYDGIKAYGTRFYINSPTAKFTWRIFGGATLATMTGDGKISFGGETGSAGAQLESHAPDDSTNAFACYDFQGNPAFMVGPAGIPTFPQAADDDIPDGGIAWSTDTPDALKCRTPSGDLKTITLT